MDREDALLSIERHSTSKLRSIEDLDTLATLGFRGEALASIAAVSKLELVTCGRDAEVGVRLSVQGGEVVSVDDVGATPGTAVEVRDLFYNLPARRRFLKGPAAEGGRITDVLHKLALCELSVHFIYVSAGREVLNAPPAADLQDRAVAVLGRDVARHLVPIPSREAPGGMTVHGMVGKPQLARPTKGHLFVSINGRPVDAPEVADAVKGAYGELLFRGRWPAAIVDVTLDPSLVDVNVHPAKLEVRFREPDAIAAAVGAAVREALEAADLVPEPALPTAAATLIQEGVAREEVPVADSGTDTGHQLDLMGGVLEEERLREAMDITQQLGEEPSWEELGHVPRWLVSLRPVGQVLDTYIVCEGEDALYLIDQHALAERLTYETIKASAAHGRLRSQRLLEPLELTPTRQQLDSVGSRTELLESLGFSVRVEEDGAVLVDALPAMLGERLERAEVDALLQDVISGEGSTALDSKEAAIRTMACHLSVRAGERLTPKKVMGLLRSMASAQDPLTCVHGRPTVLRIRRRDLERMFKRTE
jgi:DNA mismatch repair protein MutL